MNLASSMTKNVTFWFIEPVIQALEKLLRDCRLSSYFIHTEMLCGACLTRDHNEAKTAFDGPS